MNIIAIDAGGSKTRILILKKSDLTNEYYNNIRELSLGPCNYLTSGRQVIKKVVSEILNNFKMIKTDQTSVFGGFAGAGSLHIKNDIKSIFINFGFKDNNIHITSDAELLLNALGHNSILLIAGTGSICVGKTKTNNIVRAGGYGYRFLEPGGYKLGIKAIEASLKIEDGRMQEDTILYERTKDYFNVHQIEELIPLIYQNSQGYVETIAGVSRIVYNSANDGDCFSLSLISNLVTELTDLVVSVYKELKFNKCLLGLYGGLFDDKNSNKLLIKPLISKLNNENVNIKTETYSSKMKRDDILIKALRNISDRSY